MSKSITQVSTFTQDIMSKNLPDIACKWTFVYDCIILNDKDISNKTYDKTVIPNTNNDSRLITITTITTKLITIKTKIIANKNNFNNNNADDDNSNNNNDKKEKLQRYKN